MNPAKSSPSHPASARPAGSVREQVVTWLEQFAGHVRERRYAEARALFSKGVFGFGSHAYSVVGLASLEQHQWREIWDNSTSFRFDLSELRVFGEGNQVCAAVPWSSIGYEATGAPFLRPGRATIILMQEGDRLLAVHTHFSLAPGIGEKKTYPPPPASD